MRNYAVTAAAVVLGGFAAWNVQAAPRESVTFTDVLTEGMDGDAANQLRQHTFTGTYAVGRIRISATQTQVSDIQYALDSTVRITPPGGTPFVVVPIDSGPFTGSISVTDFNMRVNPALATPAGQWSFRFFEDIVDADAGADGVWNSFQFTLDDDVSLPPGDLPATARVPQGAGALASVSEILEVDGPAHMYKIQICQPSSFNATTVGGSSVDTQLALFTANGLGVAYSDQSQGGNQSTITSQFTSTLPVGDYYIAVSEWDVPALDSLGQRLWLDTPWDVERAPDGPGAANSIAGWLAGPGFGGSYAIALTGACFVGPSFTCAADVDDGTATGTQDGAVNIDDLLYYVFVFETGDINADVDNGTSTGTQDQAVTIDDLLYFLFRFEEGC